MENRARIGGVLSRKAPFAPLAFLVVAVLSVAAEADNDATLTPVVEPTSPLERQLVQSLFDARRGALEEALERSSVLVERQPDFKLAQLIRGDLLLAMAGRPVGLAGLAPRDAAVEYRHEAAVRLSRYLESPPATAVPDALLQLPPSAESAILIDLDRFRLFLFEQRDGRLRRSRDYYVSIGKGGSDKRYEGDEKTPVGIYYVTSQIPGRELPDLYGDGALPISYPNGWDRSLGRTGSGIWIHGTQSTSYSRAPLSSRGCVTLANEEYRQVEDRVRIGRTPVVVANGIRWAPDEEVERRRAEIAAAIERWRSDWESLDTEKYLGHYSADFRTEGMGLAAFAAHKRRVNAGKKRIRVELEELGIFSYPGEPDVVMADFTQRYESDSFRGSVRKQQYWQREKGRWRIVLEDKI